MFRVVLLTALSVATCAAPALVQPETKAKLWGCWTVSKSLPTTNISAISQEEIDQTIGTRIFYSNTLVRSGTTIVNGPTYSERQLSDQEFFRSFYYIPLEQIGVDATSVTVVEVEGEPEVHGDLALRPLLGLGYVFVRSTTLVVEKEGAFYELVRANPEQCR